MVRPSPRAVNRDMPGQVALRLRGIRPAGRRRRTANPGPEHNAPRDSIIQSAASDPVLAPEAFPRSVARTDVLATGVCVETDLDSHRRFRPTTGGSVSIVDLVRIGALDAELGGLLWLLIEGGIGTIVAGPGAGPADRARRRSVLGGILDLAPPDRRRLTLRGRDEDFARLADIETLGWRRTFPAASDPVDPATTILLAGELGAGPPADTTGDRARIAVRALGLGFALGATIEGIRLEDVLVSLRARPIGLTEDELSRLGVVIILGQADVATPARVTAAHYIRPLARDVHGHPQRLPPAVLAAWDEGAGRFEHFAWGIAAELAGRTGDRTGDFERERDRRAEALAELATLELADPVGIRAALERVRLGPGAAHFHGRRD